jgi:hypothetical protein
MKGYGMKIIQTKKELKAIEFKNDIIIVPILNNNIQHASVNCLCLLYIYELKSANEYLLSFLHSDTTSHLKLDDLTLLNHMGMKYVYDKKEMLQIYKFTKMNDISLMQYLRVNKNINTERYLTKVHHHFYRLFPKYKIVNTLVPILKHLEFCRKLIKRFIPIIDNHVNSNEYEFYNEQASFAFSDLEANGLHINKNKFMSNFGYNIAKYINDNKVYTKYNFNTITGRPSNSFGGINYAALNKTDDSRECFTTRFGERGTLIEFDYVAYHLHLIADIIDYKFPNNLTGHEYMASQYFDVNTPTKEMTDKSKAITFKQMYGHVSKEYEHIEFYKKLKEFINLIWAEHYTNKEVIPVIDRKTPIIDNKQKLFNYFVQNYETKRNIPLLIKVNELLKNCKSYAILYTYDSILVDFNEDDGKQIIKRIVNILTEDGKFPVKIKHGKNYKEIK